jgi:hypothetical protein
VKHFLRLAMVGVALGAQRIEQALLLACVLVCDFAERAA